MKRRRSVPADKIVPRSRSRQKSPTQTATLQGSPDPSMIERLNMERYFSSALLIIIQQNDPVLHRRITQWQQELVANFAEMMDLWGKEAAWSDLYRKLTNPSLPDRRKHKDPRSDDSKLLHEYQLIVDRVRSLARSRGTGRRDAIQEILRSDFPEVDSPDFAPGGSASETAYWILAARYTRHNIESLITRLKRARSRIKSHTYKSLQKVIHLLKSAQASSKDPDLQYRCERAIKMIEDGQLKIYRETISPLLPPT